VGPLKDIRIVEFAGIGPGPFAAMMLADMGADIVRVDRPGAPAVGRSQVLNRGRGSITLDLKQPAGTEAALRLIGQADALIEGFRPGVMERLHLGPDMCLERNPRLVYARITGWGQTGPLHQAAGHDINYIALSGALSAIGNKGEKPVPPLNLVGDFGGGGMACAFGIVCGILEARQSGQGQVIDSAMTDGSALLMAMIYDFKASGHWSNERGSNLVDGGAHFYTTYECADGKYIAVGALEPQFYALLLELTGAGEDGLAATFKTRTRAQWCEVLEGTDACFAPVLDLDEAPRHPHNVARGTFVERDGVMQPAPAPRFSRTPSRIQSARQNVLADWNFSADEIAALQQQGVLVI
jgi:alpha-methylacyl-CoA racemase